MPDHESVAALISSIETDKARLRAMLSGKTEASIGERPTPDKWSVMENVRHLVFAEYAHFGRLGSGDSSWRMLGQLPPHNLAVQRHLKMVGGESTNLDTVLETWRAVHEATRELLGRDSEEVQTALTRHRTHLRTHVRAIERLVQQQAPNHG